MYLVLIVVLLLLAVGGLPTWGFAPAGWGYYPSGGLGLLVLILLILLLMGRL
ncbi:DUF3309 family protein [Acidisphaera rubrifaciens]|uniref:DUF3309 domain-containing protein n=1 Tax=Acidisphaera rubrifaciens HS-AP3 TaxID=1231350 RepID=A0A0D6P4S9_9PROT|nr:DUF3309 family protein [Acidisphaera rubrifaciens]GAN75899.1 hypothetical protein Asru_0020_02 [Acidisphaera rubrifaciens HS-AP3]